MFENLTSEELVQLISRLAHGVIRASKLSLIEMAGHGVDSDGYRAARNMSREIYQIQEDAHLQHTVILRRAGYLA